MPRFGCRPGLELRSKNKLFLIRKSGLLISTKQGGDGVGGELLNGKCVNVDAM